jgi:uncharacterized protein YcnI/copper(I)-binding protein
MHMLSRGLLAATLCVSATSMAFAHAGISPSEASNGQSIRAAVTLPHGCDGVAIDTVIVKLPEGFVGAKPQSKPGWEISVTKGDYAKTYSQHGQDVTSGATEITWSGGSLPDDQFDDFVVSGQVMDVAPGTALQFVTTQKCGDVSVVWDQVAAEGQNPHELEHPAPVITVIDAATADEHAGHMMSMAPTEVTLGDLTLSGAFTRATLPNAPVGGGFVTIVNNGKDADRLVSASSDIAADTQIHEMKMDGEVMKMRQLTDGVEIPAGGSVTLSPGGLHIMFMKLRDRITEGQDVKVTLTFEKAGSVEIDMPAAAPGADAPASHNMAM